MYYLAEAMKEKMSQLILLNFSFGIGLCGAIFSSGLGIVMNPLFYRVTAFDKENKYQFQI